MEKHFGNDRAETRQFMDIDTEWGILNMYEDWLIDDKYDALNRGGRENESWIEALWDEVRIDQEEVWKEWSKHDLCKQDDGEWVVQKRTFE